MTDIAEVDAPVAVPAAEPAPVRFHGVACPTGVPTGDRRLLATEGFAVRALPLPIFYQRAQSQGHDGAVIVGQLTHVGLNPETNEVEYDGHFNTLAESYEAQQGVEEGWLRGVSVDLDDVEIDYTVDPELQRLMEDPNADPAEVMQAIDSQVTRFKSWRIAGLTIVGIPAYQEAYIRLGEPGTGESAPEPAGLTASVGVSPMFTLVASAASAELPPAAWFQDPRFTHATPLTIEGDRIFGHIAKWGTCHVGMQGVCTTPPYSATGYAWFRTGAVETTEGLVPTGVISMDGPHADLRKNAASATAHYDNTALAVADVAAGEDGHGIWFAGRLRPGLSAERREALQASALSGDWRQVAGNLELIAALAVNNPGFPIPRTALAASAAGQTALVAAGTVTQEDAMDEDQTETPATPDPEQLASTVKAIDAAIDECVAFLNGIGDDALGPQGQQARDLAVAADQCVDELMETLGIADPEDEAGQPGVPLEPGDALAASLAPAIAAAVEAAFARRERVAQLRVRTAGMREQRSAARAARAAAAAARFGGIA